jgi:hypothetical protein
MDSHLSGHFHVRAGFGIRYSAVIPNGNGRVRVDEFNSIDFMIGPKPIPEGSRRFLSEAGKHTIEPTNGLGEVRQSRCLECAFPNQSNRVAFFLNSTPTSRGERKRFATPITR